MIITLEDAKLSLSATDAGERANVGALFQILLRHQGKFTVTAGEQSISFNQREAQEVVVVPDVPALQDVEITPELAALIAKGTPIIDTPVLDSHDEHLLSVAEGEGMTAPEPKETLSDAVVALVSLPEEQLAAFSQQDSKTSRHM